MRAGVGWGVMARFKTVLRNLSCEVIFLPQSSLYLLFRSCLFGLQLLFVLVVCALTR